MRCSHQTVEMILANGSSKASVVELCISLIVHRWLHRSSNAYAHWKTLYLLTLSETDLQEHEAMKSL